MEFPTLLAVGGLHFAASFPMGVVPAFLQLAAPKEARAQVSALYVLAINVVGLGLGPTLVGALSSSFAPDPGGLRIAVSLVIGPAMLLSAAILCALARSTWKSLEPRSNRQALLS